MSMDRKVESQSLIPFQGSYRSGLQAGSWINSFSLVTYAVLWFVPSTRLNLPVNFHSVFGGLGFLFNTAKDWFGVFRTRTQMLPPSELPVREGLVDLQYHLKAQSQPSDGAEKVLKRAVAAVEKDNRALQSRLSGMDVVISDDVFILEAEDPCSEDFGNLNKHLKTRAQLLTQLAPQEFRSNIIAKLEQVIGTFSALQTELNIPFETNSHAHKDQQTSDSLVPPQWNTLVSYVQGFQSAIEDQSRTIQKTTEQLRAKEAEVKRLESELDELGNTANSLRKTKVKLEEELGSTKASLKEMTSKNSDLEVAAKRAEERLKELQPKLEKANTLNEAAQKELKELRDSIKEKEASLESRAKEANAKKDALVKAEEELASLRTNLGETEAALAQAEKNLRERDGQVKKVQKELSDATTRVNALLEVVPEAKAQQVAHERATEGLRTQLAEAEARSTEATESLVKAKGEAQTQTKALQKEIETQKAKIEEQKSKLNKQREEIEEQKRSIKSRLDEQEKTTESLRAECKVFEARASEAQESLQKAKAEFSGKESEAKVAAQAQASTLQQIIETQKETIERQKKELETSRAETEKLRLQNIKVQQTLETVKTSHKKEILEKDQKIKEQTDRGNNYKEKLRNVAQAASEKLSTVEEITASASSNERRLSAQVQTLESEIASLKKKARESGEINQDKLSKYHLQLGVMLKTINDALRAMRGGKGSDAVALLKEPRDADHPFYPVIHALNALIDTINGSNEPDYGSGLSSTEGTPVKKKSLKFQNRRVRMLRSKSITSPPSSPNSSFASPNASVASDTDD